MDGAGKGEVIQLLNEWLDPRGLETHSFWNLENEVSQRPLSVALLARPSTKGTTEHLVRRDVYRCHRILHTAGKPIQVESVQMQGNPGF